MCSSISASSRFRRWGRCTHTRNTPPARSKITHRARGNRSPTLAAQSRAQTLLPPRRNKLAIQTTKLVAPHTFRSQNGHSLLFVKVEAGVEVEVEIEVEVKIEVELEVGIEIGADT